MPKFRFAVRTKEGKLRTGTVTEASVEQARACLLKAGLHIVSLAQDSDLVVAQPKAPVGRPTVKTERVALIEFEVSLGERILEFLRRFVLRADVAAVVFLVGVGWAAFRFSSRVDAPPPAEPVYTPIKIRVAVQPGSLKGDSYQVLLPDIPWKFSAKFSEGTTLLSSLDSIKVPERVQVSLIRLDEVVGQGEGLLSKEASGELVASVPLDPVKLEKHSKK